MDFFHIYILFIYLFSLKISKFCIFFGLSECESSNVVHRLSIAFKHGSLAYALVGCPKMGCQSTTHPKSSMHQHVQHRDFACSNKNLIWEGAL